MPGAFIERREVIRQIQKQGADPKRRGVPMKKLSMLLVLVLVAALLTTPSLAEGTTYTQAPMLDAKVEGGEQMCIRDREKPPPGQSGWPCPAGKAAARLRIRLSLIHI